MASCIDPIQHPAPLFIGLGTAGGELIKRLEVALSPEDHARPRRTLALRRSGADPRPLPAIVDAIVGEALEVIDNEPAVAPVVLLAGLGGRTGGDACVALAIALQARGGQAVVGVLLPFSFEGGVRRAKAQAALAELQATGLPLCAISYDERLAGIRRQSLLVFFKERELELLANVARLLWPLAPATPPAGHSGQ